MLARDLKRRLGRTEEAWRWEARTGKEREGRLHQQAFAGIFYETSATSKSDRFRAQGPAHPVVSSPDPDPKGM